MKRFDPRIIFGAVLILGGGLLLLQNMGLLKNAGDFFWGTVFALAGIAFLAVLPSGSWWAVFPGMTLLALGVTILLPKSLDEFGGAVFLGGIAIAFWIVYLMERSNWWSLIPAGVLSTLAVVTLMPNRIGVFPTGAVFFLGLALTFLLVAVVVGMRWAYWPAAVLGVMGVLLSISLIGLINYIWAVALITAGGFLLYRYFTG